METLTIEQVALLPDKVQEFRECITEPLMIHIYGEDKSRQIKDMISYLKWHNDWFRRWTVEQRAILIRALYYEDNLYSHQ